MNDSKGLLVIIAVLLLGIFTVLIVQAGKKNRPNSVADSIGEVTEEIQDEIDDHTTTSN